MTDFHAFLIPGVVDAIIISLGYYISRQFKRFNNYLKPECEKTESSQLWDSITDSENIIQAYLKIIESIRKLNEIISDILFYNLLFSLPYICGELGAVIGDFHGSRSKLTIFVQLQMNISWILCLTRLLVLIWILGDVSEKVSSFFQLLSIKCCLHVCIFRSYTSSTCFFEII